MSSEGCRCGLAMNVIWKAVPGSRSCIREEGPLTELGKCTRHNGIRSVLSARSTEQTLLANEKKHWQATRLPSTLAAKKCNKNTKWTRSDFDLAWLSSLSSECSVFGLYGTMYTVCLKTGPLELIWHNFTNSQRSLSIFDTEIPYSILHWLR